MSSYRRTDISHMRLFWLKYVSLDLYHYIIITSRSAQISEKKMAQGSELFGPIPDCKRINPDWNLIYPD